MMPKGIQGIKAQKEWINGESGNPKANQGKANQEKRTGESGKANGRIRKSEPANQEIQTGVLGTAMGGIPDVVVG